MTITKVDPQDMPKITRGRHPSEEVLVIYNLQPGESIKYPCRWTHKKRLESTCSGVSVGRAAGVRAGFFMHGTCRDGIVYMMRLAE